MGWNHEPVKTSTTYYKICKDWLKVNYDVRSPLEVFTNFVTLGFGQSFLRNVVVGKVSQSSNSGNEWNIDDPGYLNNEDIPVSGNKTLQDFLLSTQLPSEMECKRMTQDKQTPSLHTISYCFVKIQLLPSALLINHMEVT